MSDVSTWSATANANNAASPNGFPENMPPSGVNDSCREVMAAVKRADAENAKLSGATFTGLVNLSAGANMGGFKITGLAAGTSPGDALRYEQGAKLAGDTFTGLVNFAAGANIASAATIDLTAATGNSLRITGTTPTSAVTMNTGQWELVIADGAWPLTYNATTNKVNTNGGNYTCAAGDRILYHKDLSGVVHGTISRADGKPVVNPTSLTDVTLTTSTGSNNLTSAGAALAFDFATTTTATGRQQLGNPGTADVFRLRNAAATALEIDSINYVYPGVDNAQNLGKAANRWKEVFAGTGTINTSDARQKTEVCKLSTDEINAAKQLANEIGWFQFLSSVAEKGVLARHHIGMTVQRAMEIMLANNLDPMGYGFICYDKWDDFVIEHEEVVDNDGNVVIEAWTEVVTKAGDSFGFRADQLALFIAAGINARLNILEGK